MCNVDSLVCPMTNEQSDRLNGLQGFDHTSVEMHMRGSETRNMYTN
jgi:hypothetical protein